jgi:hypothetical protein
MSKLAIRADEFYPTPKECYEKLTNFIDFSQFETALEPCKGDGRIVEFLESMNIKTSWAELNLGVDFLNTEFSKVDLILSNPPFSKALEFFEKSIKLSDTVIMLQRLNYLGSKSRHEWWLKNPPTGIIVLSKRPSFTGKGTDSTEYCWYIWDKTNITPKGIMFML